MATKLRLRNICIRDISRIQHNATNKATYTVWTQIGSHYCDVIMSTMASQITSLILFTQPFIQAQIKESIKAPRHWPLYGEFTGDG